MEVNINFRGGGSFVSQRPVFSEDGENVFVSWKNVVLEYNIKTGQQIYEFIGLPDRVAGFCYHSYDSNECITACSNSGDILIWKAVSHFNVYTKKIPLTNIQTFHIIPSKYDKELKAVVSYKLNEQIHFALVDIKSSKVEEINIRISNSSYFTDISENGYFAVAQGNRFYVVYFSDLQKVFRPKMSGSRKFTCIACHPTDEAILTGDSTGRVVVWQNIASVQPTQGVFHWHTLPVKCVRFSTSGSYFYSGGSECVLVKWQFNNALDRQFLPRVPAPIEHITISKNNAYSAMASGDNAIRILDSRMNQISLIQHLVLGKQHKSGIIYDPRTKALVMNGNVGQVQFYSPYDMSLLYNVEIVGQNKITNERNVQMENTEITKIAISKSGLWLATVEERMDKMYHNEIRLKFWNFDTSKQTFELNTSIEYPHENSVSKILFQPLTNEAELRCVTIGTEKKFKIWQITDVSTVYKKSVAWKCYGIGFYRDLPCQGLSFSMDGSLMSTGFGPIVTAWVPDTCELKCSLVHPKYREDITHVEFGKADVCHLLVSTSKSHVSVWNLLSLSMVWTVTIDVSLLVADMLTSHMAIVSKNTNIIVFTPGSSTPIYIRKGIYRKDGTGIVAAAFVPSRYSNDLKLRWSERSSLYFIDYRNELYCITSEEKPTHSFETVENAKDSLYSQLIPSINNKNTTKVNPISHMYEKDIGHKSIKKYLEAPIHTMAPIRLTCRSILNSLLIQKNVENSL